MKNLLSALVTALLLAPSLTFAAITIDNGPTFSGADGWNFSITAGSKLALILFVDAIGADTTACTYNSVSMTQVGTAVTNPSTDHFTMWRLVNPATGSHLISCTTAGSSYRGEEAIAYTGVDQTTPIDGSAANGSSASVSITTTVAGDFFAGNAFSNTGSVTTPYTTFTNIDIGTLYTIAGQGSAGPTTLAFTNTAGTPTLAALAVKPAAGAANIIALYTFWDF